MTEGTVFRGNAVGGEECGDGEQGRLFGLYEKELRKKFSEVLRADRNLN